jgi:hypothetical protein
VTTVFQGSKQVMVASSTTSQEECDGLFSMSLEQLNINLNEIEAKNSVRKDIDVITITDEITRGIVG